MDITRQQQPTPRGHHTHHTDITRCCTQASYGSGAQQRPTKKLVALLYTNDKWAEKEVRETSPFTIATNDIKYLGVSLTKQMKNLYEKNFKSLQKEIEEDIRKWEDLPCS
ncbi:hypothetical protein STEG23_036796 [Scotinomys teguina]